ncbi:MAG: hypothetical protein HY236_01215 [Acidobacteria bacterium]|nr:hypothetical protein [Acidobacteriota bacterium]
MAKTILEEKIEAHRKFWRGEGPSLILIPTSKMPQYDTEGYADRFENPALMWEAEMRRARAALGWPTDGIPTVRPNLGVIFIPAMVGQECTVQDGQMPWPGKPLSREAICAIPSADLESSKIMRLAREFYEVHRASGEAETAAYHPDTQGVFSLAHLLYGDQIFLDLREEPEWVHELLEITLGLHGRVVRILKSYLCESNHSFIHGHASPNGIYFPHAGVRISEDTATMVSPRMMEEFILPYTERSIAPFGGCFVHYCGKHEFLFERLCLSSLVRAIDLGNPAMYDTRWLFQKCGETGTVLFSPVAAEEGEGWPHYLRRLAGLMKETGARLILRPAVFPEGREECARMLDLWHELTASGTGA